MDSTPPPARKATASDSPATRPSLLARLQQPDDDTRWEQDWQEFHDLYQPMLSTFARKQGLGEEEAKDAVQDIFSGIAKNLPGFVYDPARCRFRTWLYRVASRKINDHWRRRQRQLPERPAENGANDADAQADLADTSTLEPDAAWNEQFEQGLLAGARRLAGQRVSVMNFRLYLHHVVQDHDADATVAAFRESGVTKEQVYLAKSRMLKLVREELERLRDKFGK